MATVFSLPSEILDLIGTYLEPDDLLGVRMTCNTLNARAKQSHLDSLYRHLRIFFTPSSLGNLIKISKHPSNVNRRVRCLTVSCKIPVNPLDILNAEEILNPGLPAGGNNFLQVISKIQDAFDEHYEEAKYMDQFGQAAALLTVAFSNLPNLQNIMFGDLDMSELTRGEVNLLYPCLGFGPGKRMPGRFSFQLKRMSWGGNRVVYHYPKWHAFSDVIHAITLSGAKQIQLIGDFENTSGIKLSYFAMSKRQLSTHKSTFENLRTLKIRLRLGIYDHIDNHPDAIPEFNRWLEAIGGNLESLSIGDGPDRGTDGRIDPDYLDPNNHHANVYILPETAGLHRLRKLCLEGLSLELDNIKQFLGSYKTRLEEIDFDSCTLEVPHEAWFEILRYLKEEVHSMRSLSIFPSPDIMGRYRLPIVTVEGDWNSDVLEWKVFPDIDSEVRRKDIGRELYAHDTADEFWDSITNGMWLAEQTRAMLR